MAEYIERQKVLDLAKTFSIDICSDEEYFLSFAYVGTNDIKSIPAADVRPVVRGKWKLDSDPGEPWRYVCNICGEKTKDTVMGKPRANYCPHCGAMMEES